MQKKKCSRKTFQKILQKIEDITFTGFKCISGYLRNLRGRLLSSEKFSEVLALWVFTLKLFPGHKPEIAGSFSLISADFLFSSVRGSQLFDT